LFRLIFIDLQNVGVISAAPCIKLWWYIRRLGWEVNLKKLCAQLVPRQQYVWVRGGLAPRILCLRSFVGRGERKHDGTR